MPAPEIIQQLVARFEDNLEAYKSGRYNETQLRRDFLDPFFEALGWDVSNRSNAAERFRDVINEQSVEIEGHAKAADYLFKIGETPVFFLEAKKPSVKIETDPASAFQIRRYAWSKKLPVSLLSDFETLVIYDCRARPFHTDPPYVGREKLFTFREYLTRWDEISGLLSRQAVVQGALDRFIKAEKGKKGTADVDDAFLVEMERWREELARNISLRNPSLTQREINSAVQLTIDRIIFLRICEDRGIEPEEGLRNATDGIDVYGDMLQLLKQADKRYNSGLFHFEKEKGQSSYPDTLTLSIKIDDRVLKDILANLYPPKSPYAFNYFSADILGQVYERFLGKVIRLTSGHQAKVEEKPEVRKAGGVYYTPKYIVEYIVKNTVGELLKDKTPEILKTIPLRVLDPACGSGSFLIGAYQYLLDWYLDWYTSNDPQHWSRVKTPALVETLGGWQLTMEKRKQILLDHIYGVDIDSQAVEVTKLSLLLKVVEAPGQLSLLGERILPDLGKNIQCGNSLIGEDYFEGLLTIDPEERHRVNPFEWRQAFLGVFSQGGFDAVIGNPPYHSIKLMESGEKDYFYSHFKSADKRFNLFSIFIERSIYILKRNGMFGNILPSALFANSQFTELRKLILENYLIQEIVDLKGGVFTGANIETAILILKERENNQQERENHFSVFYEITNLLTNEYIKKTQDQSEYCNNEGYVFTIGDSNFKRSEKIIPLNRFVNLYNGINTGNIANRIVTHNKASENHKPLIDGKDIQRYDLPIFRNQFIIYDQNYVEQLRKEWIRKKIDWTARIIKQENFFEEEKLIAQRIRNLSLDRRLVFTYDNNKYYVSINVTVITSKKDSKYNIKYFLGILNSNFMNNYFKRKFHSIQIKNQFLDQLPIYEINFSDQADLERYNLMVALVDRMLVLHNRKPTTSFEQEQVEREIESTDRQINNLVYDLYGQTEDEIKIIEGS